ncbi:hypothetical protein ABB37_04266 [Leptomonas pyrrhocoris]|uniref:Ankyrin repeat protein n=1 Tax=Leptomonas pyrrhocoris TaxID=157538 RepID=A0A0M9G2D9_LEPPY|nr:hypothetical protein ABB37_04266 [Leptomonas pyrrhocoris]XP_015659282.1 hypothetical protein ABB37_04266 [Leptomonas pyrrhocoris]KPA80842.1 hypothetical protein ABB37_04266 [Leptomonas pyrrhocoris]KPA80843.1 hypothetical protein ABB37_04266 [Leptomonas pyrrhocoris]|eukprot:XP_015659281.1 hypothetical protein ABB37_04266 [Leptomonas pyrrhocoris]
MSTPADPSASAPAASAAVVAAAAKKAARHKAASNKEDPLHTWNQQLMEACLACDLARVEDLVERGADPVNAREVPPPAFYAGALGTAVHEQHLQRKRFTGDGVDAGEQHGEAYGVVVAAAAAARGVGGEGNATEVTSASSGSAATANAAADRLSPLAAMLLSGLDSPAARGIVAFLLQRGASVNDPVTYTTTQEATNEGDATGAGDDAAAGNRAANSGETKKGAKTKAPPVSSRFGSAAQAAAGGGGNADDAQRGQQEEERSVDGSVLHCVVSRGDHAQLLRLLLLAAPLPPQLMPPSAAAGEEEEGNEQHDARKEEKTNAEECPAALPYSLLSAVEQETVVGALRHQQLASLPPSVNPVSTSGGGKSDDAAAAAAAAPAPSNGQQQQQQQPKGKGKQGGATAPVPSGPESPRPTATWVTDSILGGNGPFTISAAAAEAVLAAFQKRQQRPLARGASAGGVRGGGRGLPPRRLPILMSAYPHLDDGDNAGVHAGDAPRTSAALWNLQKLCRESLKGQGGAGEGDMDPHRTTSEEGEGARGDGGDWLKQRTELDFTQVDSLGCTAATIALQRGDTLSLRLLYFFGAPMPFHDLVNATQTRLARACARGNVARVEHLLRHGDRLSQLSADGRYTLIHYAAAQPAVLKVLTEHGLSLEYENVWGESAVLSLLRHGTARNDAKYVQTLYGTAAWAAANAAAAAAAAAAAGGGTDGVNISTSTSNTNATNAAAQSTPVPPTISTAVSNAIAFTQLPPSAQRNYILCPPLQLPLLTTTGSGGAAGGGGNAGRGGAAKDHFASASARRISTNPSAAAASTSNNASAASAAARLPSVAPPAQPFFGGREAGTWWSFLPPTTTTAEAVDTLLKAGAVLQGYIPDEDLDLPYVRFGESQTAAAAAAGGTAVSDEHYDSGAGDEGEEREEDFYGSRTSMSGSASTAVPFAGHYSSSQRRQQQHQQQLCPGRLSLRVTPLQQAIFDYHPELIRRLVIDYRVDPMQRDSQGATALHYAALCAHAPTVLEMLLSPQVMLMHVKPAGGAVGGGGAGASTLSAVMGGESSGPAEAVISIPAAVGSKIDLNCTDMAGRTPLFYAALVGNEAAVKLLLRFGVLLQVGRADRDGWTPLHVAVRQQHPTVVVLLLRHTKQLLSSATAAGGGPDVFSELLGNLRGAGGARGTSSTRAGSAGRRGSQRSGSFTSAGRLRRSDSNTAAAAAAAAAAGGGPVSPTDLLFANGGVALVDVEAEERSAHATPLELLIRQTRPAVPASAAEIRVATALLAEGQASSLRPSGLPNGGSLLHRVVADGQVELARLLLSYYANPDEVDDVDETPLFLAVRQTPPSSAAPQQDETDEAATSPASFAADDEEQQQQRRRCCRRDCRTSLIRTLLEYGATPSAQSGTNLDTPQHLAARRLATPSEDNEELLQMLFYTVPDRKSAAAAAAAGSRGRRADSRSKSREPRLRPRLPDSAAAAAADAESALLNHRGGRKTGGAAGAKESALRRRLNRNSSEGGRAGHRPSSQDGSARDRRGQQRLAGQQQQPSPSSSASAAARRRLWTDEAGDAADAAVEGLYGDGLAEDQLSLADSSVASGGGNNTGVFGDDDDRSVTTSRPESGDVNDAHRGAVDADASGEGATEADHRRAALRQWQCAEHLLSPSHCWLLTDAQGQTPLHVLCSSACHAVQRLPALLRLLKDLEAYTLMRESANSGDREVLSMVWGLQDAHGRTPLHAAAESGFVEAMEIILRMSPLSVVAVDAQGRTPLHACVLMRNDLLTSSPTAADAAAEVTAKAEIQEEEEQRQQLLAARLQRMMTTLRDTLSRLTAEGKAVPLHGQPIRRTGQDVLPTPFHTTAAADRTPADLQQQHGGLRAVAALVQPSTITEQLQRWQKTRHWGARPLLLRGADADAANSDANNATRLLQMDAASGSGVRSWTAYTQLPDGQGRTALLLAAELGNRSAARALLQQA